MSGRSLGTRRRGAADVKTVTKDIGDAQKLPLQGAPWTDRGTTRDGSCAGCRAVIAGLDWRHVSKKVRIIRSSRSNLKSRSARRSKTSVLRASNGSEVVPQRSSFLACSRSAPTRPAAALNFATAADSLILGRCHSCSPALRGTGREAGHGARRSYAGEADVRGNHRHPCRFAPRPLPRGVGAVYLGDYIQCGGCQAQLPSGAWAQ